LAAVALLIGACCCGPFAFADGDCGSNFTTVQFVRDDLASLKKSMETALAAIPSPQGPYGKGDENWNLPSYACQDKSGLRPVDVSYSGRYTTEASTRKMGEEYQKRLLAAQAKGDYEAVAKITQEMQQKILQQAAANEQLRPIDINVAANAQDARTIDPDSVLRDGEGFLALRTDKDASSGTERVSIYFDPVALKNAHQLARFDMSGDFRTPSKLALLSLRIDLNGPSSALEAMVKNVDAAKVLGTLTAARKNLRGKD
jgi:hypothetical protein